MSRIITQPTPLDTEMTLLIARRVTLSHHLAVAGLRKSKSSSHRHRLSQHSQLPHKSLRHNQVLQHLKLLLRLLLLSLLNLTPRPLKDQSPIKDLQHQSQIQQHQQRQQSQQLERHQPHHKSQSLQSPNNSLLVSHLQSPERKDNPKLIAQPRPRPHRFPKIVSSMSRVWLLTALWTDLSDSVPPLASHTSTKLSSSNALSIGSELMTLSSSIAGISTELTKSVTTSSRTGVRPSTRSFSDMSHQQLQPRILSNLQSRPHQTPGSSFSNRPARSPWVKTTPTSMAPKLLILSIGEIRNMSLLSWIRAQHAALTGRLLLLVPLKVHTQFNRICQWRIMKTGSPCSRFSIVIPAFVRVATWMMPSTTYSHTLQCVPMTIRIIKHTQSRVNVSTTSLRPLLPRSNRTQKPNQVTLKWWSEHCPINLSQQPSMQAHKPSSTIWAVPLLTKIAMTIITTQLSSSATELTTKA